MKLGPLMSAYDRLKGPILSGGLAEGRADACGPLPRGLGG